MDWSSLASLRGGFADDFELTFDCGARTGSCRRLRATSRPPRASPASVAALARVPLRFAKGTKTVSVIIDGFSGLIDLVSEVRVLDGGVVD